MADYTVKSTEEEKRMYCETGKRQAEEKNMKSYIEFLKDKVIKAPVSGIEVNPADISSVLKPHQRDAVLWALKGGRRALFEAFGLGKSIQQLEWCHVLTKKIGGKALIVCPLGVKQEFAEDAVHLLNIPAPTYVRNMEEVKAADNRILITNYERIRDGDIDPHYFTACSLDEASVLRSFGSKTYQTFLPKFKGVKYKLVATATPAPNRYKELIHYGGYLEIMDTGQALTRFFQRDSTKANNLTLYPHKEKEFWLWLSTWALFIQKPSDLGYSDEGYNLPPLQVNYHMLANTKPVNEEEKNGQVKLIKDFAVGLSAAAREKRESIDIRLAETRKIIDQSPAEHFIVWHDLESERYAIKHAIPEAKFIYGSQDMEEREKNTIGFSRGDFRILATKKELSGSGCNFQKHCHRQIFMGIDYEFNDFIQAIHRCYRFLQTKPVIIDIIYMETEQQVLEVLKKKWEQYNKLTESMEEIVRKYGLSRNDAIVEMQRSIGVEEVITKGKNYIAIHGDCVEETGKMQDNSVDMLLTSIPFGNHYEYCASYNDFGHNENTDKFFEQMDYLTPNLLRILKPGRVYACHVKDRVLFGNATGTGMPTIEPFHALTIMHYMKHSFQFFGMITVITDVVRENNQTYRLGWTEQCKDGTKMGVGCPEYILLFRKLPTDTSRAYADTPVTKNKEEYTRGQWQLDAHAFWRSSGNRQLSVDDLKDMPISDIRKLYNKYSKETVYDFDKHVEMANAMDEKNKLPATFMCIDPASWSPDVWDDVNRMRTLNTEQSQRRKQMHLCPLQFDIVDRLINRYTNEGETVLDPFGGLMTVPLEAMKAGRKGIGIELNPEYYRDGCWYLKREEDNQETPTLFDFMEGK
jgi:DNA modification methylase